MRSNIRGTAAALMSLSLFACTHAGDGSPSSIVTTASVVQRSAPGSMFLVTGTELRARGSSRTLMEAVAAIRPTFLRYRGSRPTVVIDGVTRGSVETLNDITIEAVERVQLLSGPDATIRFGTRHSGAVLLVTTRRP